MYINNKCVECDFTFQKYILFGIDINRYIYSKVGCSTLILQSFEMETGIENDPRHHESSKRGHETLLHELPNSAVLFFVDLLKINAVHIHNSTVN